MTEKGGAEGRATNNKFVVCFVFGDDSGLISFHSLVDRKLYLVYVEISSDIRERICSQLPLN